MAACLAVEQGKRVCSPWRLIAVIGRECDRYGHIPCRTLDRLLPQHAIRLIARITRGSDPCNPPGYSTRRTSERRRSGHQLGSGT